ncbi:hypothetical protein N7467_010421 [Penicillium canescens]|nr:hypothetical protein N7467_010421 [Penicillium canescens]
MRWRRVQEVVGLETSGWGPKRGSQVSGEDLDESLSGGAKCMYRQCIACWQLCWPLFRVWGQWQPDESIAIFRAGIRIINTIPQAEGHTISAPQEPQNPVSHCTDVMEPNTIGATGGPSVRFVPEVAMAMGDDTRWPAPSM